MRKSLSRKICELCKIKPKMIQDYELNDIVIYPDFENNNNNFVKLFNLITTIEDFSFRTGFYCTPYIPSYRQLSCLSTPDGEYESENIDPIKAFLTCVFKCCYEEKDTADYIRETNWEI